VLLSKAEYEELLKRTGFFIEGTQRSISDELKRQKKRHKKENRFAQSPRRLGNKIRNSRLARKLFRISCKSTIFVEILMIVFREVEWAFQLINDE
jgi:hypothetical protein